MKKCITLFLGICSALLASAQEGVKLSDLAVPNSPAFILTDLTPTLVQTPNSPKKFVLGLAQNYEKSNGGFPENYSAEFAPYWFMAAGGRNVYAAAGLKTSVDGTGKIVPGNSENIFSGLKFTSLSLAFINKDLLPDGIDNSHKVFALGVRSTILKVQQAGYAQKLKALIANWHTQAQIDITAEQAEVLAGTGTQADLDRITEKYADLKVSKSLGIAKEISELTAQKPVFSWDLAGAYSSYAIGEQEWTNGRSGIWTTVSSYLPLLSPGSTVPKNYFNLNFSLRSTWDNFTKNDLNQLVAGNNIDIGGKAALEFDGLSIGIESLNRYINKKSGKENRTVGLINYKIDNNIFLTGAFGKNFESQSRSISMLGINWGFGSEKVNLK